MISEPSRRISACSRPTALLAASSERNELEQTSSARPSVRCASVIRNGRISCRTTRMPALASCQAASEPARPPPITWTVSVWGVAEIMRAGLARFRAKRTCHGVFERSMPSDLIRGWIPVRGWKRQRPQRRRALSVRQAAEPRSAAIVPGRNARNVRTIEADIGELAIAELGQFADIALIIPERLDHADERQ